MFLTSRKFVKKLLAEHGIKPSKRLGQHFLVDRGVLRDIIAAAELTKDDMALEIGPGIGTLTTELAKRAQKVIAVEKDKKMVEILEETLNGYDNIKCVQADILKKDVLKDIFFLEGAYKGTYKVVANLPYYIVAPVTRLFLEMERSPQVMTLMVQKEVAQRICAKPPRMNLLAVSVQFYAEPKIVRYVRKASFWPQPKVDSAIIKIIPRQPISRQTYSDTMLRERFFKIVKAGFSQPRKQLLNNLSGKLKVDKRRAKTLLLKSNINPHQRAENLSVGDWVCLSRLF